MTVQITIIGMGQIGASIGLALAEHKGLVLRVGHDKDIRVANQAKQVGALDRVDLNIPHAVREAGVVVLALPLDQVRSTLAALAQDLKPEAVVLDTAPVKEVVAAWAKELLPPQRHYVGMTPVINPAYLQEHEIGVGAAHADLFRNGLMAIVSPPGAPSEAVKLATDFSRLLGAEHLFMDPVELDSLMASTHLLPQLMAAALLNATVDQPGWFEARKLAGRAYAEVTGPGVLPVSEAGQEARGEAAELASAALGSQASTLRAIDNLLAALTAMRNDIRDQNTAALIQRLERAHQGRQRWWQERLAADWAASESAPPVELPTAKEIINRWFGMGRKPKSEE
jgi:prephenate dehydrogenase